MSKSLFNKLKDMYANNYPVYIIDGEYLIIEQLSDGEEDTIISEIDELVRNKFEGKLKDCEYVYCGEYRYLSIRSISETAKVI